MQRLYFHLDKVDNKLLNTFREIHFYRIIETDEE